MAIFSFWVLGQPRALQGLNTRQGRPGRSHVDPRTSLWRESIEWAAMASRADDHTGTPFPLDGPVALVAWFWLPMSPVAKRAYATTGVRPMPCDWAHHQNEPLTGYAQVALDGMYDVILERPSQVVVLVTGKGYCLPNESPAAQFTLYSGEDLYAYAISTPPVPADRPAVPPETAPARRGPRRSGRTRRLPGAEKSARPPLYWFDGVRLCRRLDPPE